MKLQNIIITILGAFTIYWAQMHSPKAGIGQISKNFFSGSYTMSQNWYYVSLGLGIVVTVYGLLKIFKVLK
ncbi:MAG: hypothetical protein JXR07_08050 [Reichenbachiella sp.]